MLEDNTPFNPFAPQERAPELPPIEDRSEEFAAEVQETMRVLWDWCDEHNVPILIAIQLQPATDSKSGMHIFASNIPDNASQTMRATRDLLGHILQMMKGSPQGRVFPEVPTPYDELEEEPLA